jgi:hypothetical protein
MSFNQVKMAVTSLNAKTKKREPVGEVVIHVPLLDELGIKADQLIDADKKPVFDDDGLPVYADDKYNFAQNAIYAAVKAQARNKLEAGTATLKAGATISTNWDELTAEANREGSGAALVLYRELKTLFSTYINSTTKSAGAKAMIINLFGTKNALIAQDAVNKGKMKAYVAEFATTLTPETLAKYMKPLEAVTALCDTTTDAEDF